MSKNHYQSAITLLLGLFIVFGASAQRGGNTAWTKYRHEVAIGYGVNTLLGALGERDNLGFNPIFQRSTFNGTYRYFFLKRFAVRGSLSHGFSRKNDKDVNIEDRYNERIDYTATMTEIAALAEYHIFDEATKGKRGKVRRARGGTSRGMNIGLSLHAGLALGFLRPFGEYMGREIELKPIADPIPNPNNDKYKRMGLYFPIGTQVRFILSENWRFGIEAGYRIGLRDYVNNVSGVYYRDKSVVNPGSTPLDDPSYIGNVTFDKEAAPLSELASENGRRNYLFSFLTLAYRFKS